MHITIDCCCCQVTSVVSDWLSVTHRRQPTRLLCPWDSPGKNTGVGHHLLLQCTRACYVTSVGSDSVWLHGQQPTSLLCPRDSLGKNIGVGCHFLLLTKDRGLEKNEMAEVCPYCYHPSFCSEFFPVILFSFPSSRNSLVLESFLFTHGSKKDSYKLVHIDL